MGLSEAEGKGGTEGGRAELGATGEGQGGVGGREGGREGQSSAEQARVRGLGLREGGGGEAWRDDAVRVRVEDWVIVARAAGACSVCLDAWMLHAPPSPPVAPRPRCPPALPISALTSLVASLPPCLPAWLSPRPCTRTHARTHSLTHCMFFFLLTR